MRVLMKHCAVLLAVLAILLLRPMVAAETSAADLYKSKCAICHGGDGAGDTPMGKRLEIRDLRSEEAQSLSDEEIQQLVTNGGEKMPAQKTLSAEEVHLLTNFIRGFAKAD